MSPLSLLVCICVFNELSLRSHLLPSVRYFVEHSCIAFIIGASIIMSSTTVIHCMPQCFFCRTEREDHSLISHVMDSSASCEQMESLRSFGHCGSSHFSSPGVVKCLVKTLEHFLAAFISPTFAVSVNVHAVEWTVRTKPLCCGTHYECLCLQVRTTVFLLPHLEGKKGGGGGTE